MNDTYGHDFGDEVLKGDSSLLIRNEKHTMLPLRWGRNGHNAGEF
ncbi:MAG: diguanylate cyclase [Treponema sp.]|nr:diguanylate cyclase [Treponema sp.]